MQGNPSHSRDEAQGGVACAGGSRLDKCAKTTRPAQLSADCSLDWNDNTHKTLRPDWCWPMKTQEGAFPGGLLGRDFRLRPPGRAERLTVVSPRRRDRVTGPRTTSRRLPSSRKRHTSRGRPYQALAAP